MARIKTETSTHPLFHTAAHYESSIDILKDDTPEKRIILSSWASNMYAVESCAGLREIPGMDHAIPLADILAVLRQLDGDDEDPTRGSGVPMPVRRPSAPLRRYV